MRPTPSWVIVVALVTAFATLAGAASRSGSAAASSVSPVTAGRSAHATLDVAEGRVRIDVRFRMPTSGTFAITGVVSDGGTFRGSRRVASGRTTLTQVLAGRHGTIRIRAQLACAVGSGTWRVISGTDDYRDMTGGGSARRGPGCATARYPVAAIYTGIVRTPPPPPLAQAGRYGGGTSQREEVTFEVPSGGRSVAAFRLRVTVRCSPTLSVGGRVTLPGPSAIGADGRFSLQTVTPSGGTQTVAGRFSTPTTAVGTMSIAGTFTDTIANTRIACAGEVTWTASLPPPGALPGTYCGFTLQGPGICLDTPTGKEVTRFESAVVVRCFPGNVPPSEFEIALTFSGSMPVGGHLGFSASAIPVEGLVSGTGSITGLFEPTGTASGGVSLGPVVLDYEGTRYRCQPATGKWQAKRQV
jgi:hypothetical protein